MEPTWPTHVTGAAVTSFTKTDRSDGYDFSLSFRYERENGVPEIWDTTGSVFQRSDGLEQK